MTTIGSTLNNRYRLDRLVGEGGFAHVFLATDLELGRQVAIKILDANWIKDKDLLTRFRNEARAVAVLEHPNILIIYDYGVARGSPYLVMPYISGGTLATRMKEGPFTLDEIRFYLEQIGAALDYAHQRGIVHRDVKPSNLLMRPDGQLVLMDFGLAKLLDNAAFASQSMIVGTVAYLAPEQYQGLVTPASDIYMLGIILYEMLVGQLPYEGNTAYILDAHLHSTPRSLVEQPTMQSVPAPVVQALDQVILKALAKHPIDRYQTGQALTFAYTKALNADPDRAARYNSRDKNLDLRNLDGTLLTQHPLVVAPAAAPKGVDVKPALKSPSAPVSNAAAPKPSPLPIEAEATIIERKTPRHEEILVEPPHLLVTTEPDKGFQATFDLTGETLTLGRASDNQLCIPLPIVSRYHAVLNRLNDVSQQAPCYKIVQSKSINPLRINGKRIAEKVLENGDVIEIGDRGYAEYIVKLTYQAAESGI